MIVTTASTVEGRPVHDDPGIMAGEAIPGATLFKDIFAGLRDIVGGRPAACEAEPGHARRTALTGMEAEARRPGTDAVVGVDLDYEVINNMRMVSASGTSVRPG